MKKLLFVLPLILALGFGGIAIITNAYGNEHPDACQPCHGQTTTVSDVNNLNLWSHNIEKGGNVWNNCGNCHSAIENQISTTPHSGIGCKCHAVLHAGYNATGNIYGVAFYMLPNENIGTSLGKISPAANNLVKKQIEFDETNLTSIATYYGWGTDGMEIEVGMVNLNKEFLTVSADGQVSSNGWQVCFNCHFISTNPSTVGAFKFVDGVWKIGIPQEALSMNPHAVSEIDVNAVQPGNEAAGLTANMLPLTVSIIMGLIGALVAIFGRK